MDIRAGAHPSAETLQAFSLGKIDDFQAESLVAHVANCPACQKAAAAMSSDGFLERLRAAHSSSGTPAPAKPLSGIPQSQWSTASPSPTPLPVPGLPPELVNHPQYAIIRELGRGGMGVVYLARNKLLARLEVLKVVNKAILEQPGVADRFLREIQSAALLNHPNVVTAYSALQLGGSLAFAMEYVDGEDLAKLMKARGSLPVAYACYCAREAALGLQHAHEKKMVHRDIKPQNLILARDGAKHIVKVLDFGLAKVLREGGSQKELTASGVVMGTPDYIAPEQTIDAANADIRADIYSLGCTLYYLLTGEPPFKGGNLFAILYAHQSVEAKALNLVRAEIPAELADVVHKMMAKAPEQRYQTPGEVARALAPFIKQKAVGVPVGASQLVDRNAVVAPVAKPIVKVELPPAASRVETVGGFGSTSAEVRKAKVAKRARPVKQAASKKWLLAGTGGALGLLVLLALLGVVGLWAAGVFKVKTKDGTIVLENLPPDADVTVDGEKVTVKAAGGQMFEVSVDASKKKHRIEVKKDGFKVFGDEVEVDAGGRKSVLVRLEPIPLEKQPGDDKEKWVSLFNGKDLVGWIIDGGEAGQWDVEDGAIVGRSKDYRTRNYLLTKKDYADYALRFDFIVNDESHGGVAIRAIEGEKLPIQDTSILDHPLIKLTNPTMDAKEPTGTTHWLKSAEVYVPPSQTLPLPSGIWRTMEVIVRGGKCTATINGKQIVNVTLDPDIENKGVVPGLQRVKGKIGFQINTGTVRYRNIKIKELPPKAEEQGFVPLFNGKDLTGWKVLDGKMELWGADKGILYVEGGGGGWLMTEQEYGDFELRLECKIPKTGNSGVALRAPLFGDPAFQGMEVQILDDANYSDLRPTQLCGSIYDVVAPAKDATKPFGEWNTCKISAKGKRITIELNGVKIVDANLDDYIREHGVRHPGLSRDKGHLGLQSHDGRFEFRNIEIKELPPGK